LRARKTEKYGDHKDGIVGRGKKQEEEKGERDRS